MRPRTRRPSAISTGSSPSSKPKRSSSSVGLEAAVRVRLGAQVAQQVELEPPRRGAHARLLGRELEVRRAALAQLLEQDALGVGQVGVRHAALAGLLAQAARRCARAPSWAYEPRTIASGSGTSAVRPQHVLHEPLHRAVGEALERARPTPRRARPARRAAARALSGAGPGSARRGPAAACARSHSAAVGASSGRPGHVGERARRAARRRSLEQAAHVVDEERLRLRVALLVARARAEHEQPLGARGADVEEVALAVEAVLAHGQHQPARRGDRAAVVVGQERLGRGAARELALLEPAGEHRLEAARPDRLRRGHLHAVRLRVLAHVHLELLEHALDLRPARRAGRPQHGPQLARARAAPALQRARLLELRPAEDRSPCARRAPRTGARAAHPARRRTPPCRARRASRSSSSSGQRSRSQRSRASAAPCAPSRRTSASRRSARPGTRRRPGRAQVGEQVLGACRRATRSGSARAGRGRGRCGRSGSVRSIEYGMP